MLCDEKGLTYEVVFDAVEIALAAAYRKDFGSRQGNYVAKFDVETGDINVWDIKEVVADHTEEEIEQDQEALSLLREQARIEDRDLTDEETAGLIMYNPKTQLMLAEAKAVKPEAEIGETLEILQKVPGDFGRMAAQTAKQVIIQKIREAERKSVFEDFKEEEGKVVQGIVQRRDRSGGLIIDFGKVTGIVPPSDTVRGERYTPGQRMQFYVLRVEMGARGPEIILSRSSNKMVESVFAQEIPEIDDGSVQIKVIARDPGHRSKVAVFTEDDSIDPIGACIGQRGSRITTIISELGGEKIDVIQWSNNTMEFIKNALSPAKVSSVELDEETREATVFVPADQFSLAIGRGGQNVRLGADLTGWKLNVVQDGGDGEMVSSESVAEGDVSVGEVSESNKTEAMDGAEEPKAKVIPDAPIVMSDES